MANSPNEKGQEVYLIQLSFFLELTGCQEVIKSLTQICSVSLVVIRHIIVAMLDGVDKVVPKLPIDLEKGKKIVLGQ
jgi:hypothetical protein